MTEREATAGEPDVTRLYYADPRYAKDPAKAVGELRALVDEGSVAAMLHLGAAFWRGFGVAKDLDKARDWFQRAANAGSTSGYHNLGLLYLKAKRYAEAVSVFSVAVEKGYPPSLAALGSMYRRGVGLSVDLLKARDLLERSVASGNPRAMRRLGMLLLATGNTLQDRARGVNLYARGLKELFRAVQRNMATKDMNDARSLEDEGKFRQAEKSLRHALKRYQKSGASSTILGFAFHCLAVNLNKQNRYSEAESFARSAVRTEEDAFGSDSRNAAIALQHLASNLDLQARLDESESLYRRALAILESTAHPTETANCLHHLANNLNRQRRRADAESAISRAIMIYENTGDAERLSECLLVLATIIEEQGRHAEAEPIHRRSLAIREQSYGPNDIRVARELSALGMNLDAQNKFVEAEPIHRRSAAIRERCSGPNDARVAYELVALGASLRAQNRFHEAEPALRRAVQIYETKQGWSELHRQKHLAPTLLWLAECLNGQTRNAEAAAAVRRASAICEALGDEEGISAAATIRAKIESTHAHTVPGEARK